jgi:hypothetical protein
MYSWGNLFRGHAFGSESKCWRCLDETVPEDDELGLCETCIAELQDSPRSSRSLRSPSTTPRA